MSVAPAENTNEAFMAAMDSGKMPWPFSKLPTTERGEQGEAKVAHGLYVVFVYALLVIPLASPLIGFLAAVRGIQNASKVEDDLVLKISRIFLAMGYGLFLVVYTLTVELVKHLVSGGLEIFEACVTQ